MDDAQQNVMCVATTGKGTGTETLPVLLSATNAKHGHCVDGSHALDKPSCISPPTAAQRGIFTWVPVLFCDKQTDVIYCLIRG